MAAKIINASYVGSVYQYVVSSNIGELFIVVNETKNYFKLDEEVFIRFDVKGILSFESNIILDGDLFSSPLILQFSVELSFIIVLELVIKQSCSLLMI